MDVIEAELVPPTLTTLFRYPIKSCRGEQLPNAVVEPWGLAGDRRWMLVDAHGRFVTARDRPRLLLVRPSIEDGAIRLSGPDSPDLIVEQPTGEAGLQVTVWQSEVLAMTAGEAAGSWFSALIGEPVQLVYLDDPTRRATNPDYSRDTDRVSFADGYPLLLTTESSLDALNDLIGQGPKADEGPLPMRRFRPNVVVDTTPAWDEDYWSIVRIGSTVFRVAKGCARCVMTTVDPDTAAKGKEPLATLARHRRWDGGVWFGINLIPESATSVSSIAVGDRLEVLERR